MRVSSRSFPALLSALSLSACYGTRPLEREELRQLVEPSPCRVVTRDGRRLRLLLDAASPEPGRLVGRRCRYRSESWTVAWSGWPAVYSSGKHWRRESSAEEIGLAEDEIESMEIEQVSWAWTVLTLPLTLPPGLIDFVIRNAEVGFDQVIAERGSFSRVASR